MSAPASPVDGGRIGGIVLAAGDSSRMGTPKAALDLAGRTFVAHVLGALADGGAEPLVVVAGRHANAVRAALPASVEVTVLLNPEPARGQLSSLKLALAHLSTLAPPVAGAVVALVDHPAVRPDTVAALVEAIGRSRGAAATVIAIPAHGGRRGHPVAFARTVWDELLATPVDLGARAVTHADPSRVQEVPVDDPGILRDIDTPADLADLRSRSPRA